MSVEQTALRVGRRASGRDAVSRLRVAALGLLGLVAVAALWELYKLIGPADGVSLAETRVLPRNTDIAMPHVWEMIARVLEPTTSQPGAPPLWQTVGGASVVTLGMAGAGWLVGTVVGMLLGLAMNALKVVERGLLPWVIVSQTVPLIAFAPVVNSVGSRLNIGALPWPDWLSIAVIASYLAFFPVAVGTLTGLQSAPRTQLELLHCYAATGWQRLRTVQLPAAVPYLLPAARLGAASAVIGAIVAEVSTGYLDGIGRQLLAFAGQASGDPAKAWAPIFGAVAIGLVAAGAVGLAGASLRRFRRGEAV